VSTSSTKVTDFCFTRARREQVTGEPCCQLLTDVTSLKGASIL